LADLATPYPFFVPFEKPGSSKQKQVEGIACNMADMEEDDRTAQKSDADCSPQPSKPSEAVFAAMMVWVSQSLSITWTSIESIVGQGFLVDSS
jgi:hypothetical protein